MGEARPGTARFLTCNNVHPDSSSEAFISKSWLLPQDGVSDTNRQAGVKAGGVMLQFETNRRCGVNSHPNLGVLAEL